MLSSLSGPSRRLLAVRGGIAMSGLPMSAPTAIAMTAGTSCSFSTAPSSSHKNVVIVDGVRLPFAMSSTIYSDELAVDLQRLAFQGLMTKTALDKSLVDYVIAGNVIQEVRTSNIAREASLNAGLPISIGSHTIAMVRTYSCSPMHYIPA
jgi:acetyl-CoA acyltransferase